MKRLLVLVIAVVLVNNIYYSQELIGKVEENDKYIELIRYSNGICQFSFLSSQQYEGFMLDEEEKDEIYLTIKSTLSNKEEKEYDFKAKFIEADVKLIMKNGKVQFVLYFLGNEHKSGYFNLEEINKLFGS